MHIKDIVNDTDKAGDTLIQAAYLLLDEGRKVQDIARDISMEYVEVAYLSALIAEVDGVIHRAGDEAKEAVAMLRRLPYGGGRVQYD